MGYFFCPFRSLCDLQYTETHRINGKTNQTYRKKLKPLKDRNTWVQRYKEERKMCKDIEKT